MAMLSHRVAVATRPAAFPRSGAGPPRRKTRIAEVFVLWVIVQALLAFPTTLLCRHIGIPFLAQKPTVVGGESGGRGVGKIWIVFGTIRSDA